MKEFKIDNKGSTRLFSSNILEQLTRTNFLFPIITYYVGAILFILLSYFNKSIHFSAALWLIPLGWLLFTLVEYLVHRFVFHFHATTEKQLNIQYSIHGVHHEFPRDKERLVMPPVVSIIMASGFYFLFVLLLDDYAMLFFSGFIAGYSSYLILHYSVHALKPPKNMLKLFWKHHSLHHYDSVHSAFSVSMPLWDYLFRTVPKSTGKARQAIENRLPDLN